MREGCGVADFLNPTVIVLGADDHAHLTPLRELYAESPGQIFETSLGVAEMVKYVGNAFDAVKVTFANEIATLSHQLGADALAVIKSFMSDTRLNISRAYLTLGFA